MVAAVRVVSPAGVAARAAVVLAKTPALGRCKTRVASVFGDAAALQLAEAMLADTLDVVRAARVDVRLLCLDGPGPAVDGFELAAQPDGDLGLRQADALSRALGYAPRAVLLGTDAEALGPGALEAALDALDDADGCVVPAEDGGFVALAVRGMPAGLLDGLPWSSPGTCDALRRRFRRAGLRLVDAPVERDVDTAEDVARLAAAPDSSAVRPRVAAVARALVAARR